MARVILLTQREFAPAVAPTLQAAGAEVHVATTLEELAAALVQPARLISFGAGVIVPPALLAALSGPAYNFHPGPPEYPGLFPSVFALYAGESQFGVTLHEMAAVVDSGPIVAVERFALLPEWDRLALDTETFGALTRLFAHHAGKLAQTTAPLARCSETWGAPRRTRKDFEALCELPDGASDAEFARRYRAIGEGPEHALSITRFGRTFRLAPTRGGAVVRGGQLSP